MKMLWYEKGIPVCIVLTLLLGVAGFLRMWQDIGRPFGGYLSTFNPVTKTWVIDWSTPSWWPVMNSADRLYYQKDELLELEGHPYDFDQGKMFAAAYHHSLLVHLLISRNGQSKLVRIPVIPFALAHFIDVRLPDLLIGLSFWLVAIVVYRAQSTVPLNRFFALYCCLMAAFRWLDRTSVFWQEGMTGKFLDLLRISILYPVLSGATLDFALLFPKPALFRRPFIITATYSIATIGLLTHTASRLLFWQYGWLPSVAQLDKWATYSASCLGISGAIILVVRLLWTLINKSSLLREKRQAGLLLIGITIASAWLLPGWAITFGKIEFPFFWGNVDTRYFLLALPLFTTMAILRYQAFHGQSQLLLLVPILLISAVLAILSTFVFNWTQVEFQQFSRNFISFVPAFTVAVVASIVWSTQSSWRGFFGHLFHWEQRSYEAVKRFGQQLVGQNNLAQLPELIADALVQELELEQAAVYLYHDENISFCLAGQSGLWSQDLPGQVVTPVEQLTEASRLFRLNTPGFSVPTWLDVFSSPAEVAFPLQVSGRGVGLLVLGKRWDEEIINERDLAIIELIGQQAALFLLTAVQIEELRRVPRLVDEAQERERTKIAQELHDTIQQFLGRLPFFLEVSRTNDELRDQILLQCIADIDDAARTLRQIRNNLTTSQVENGLAQPLSHLVSRFRQRTGIDTHLEVMPQLDSLLNLNARHALYRVVQQALDNVVEHAGANHVTVQLAYQNGQVTFHIQDDGHGSSEMERLQAQDRGGFGLKSMSARVKNLNGGISFISSPGAGTQITGWLPVSA